MVLVTWPGFMRMEFTWPSPREQTKGWSSSLPCFMTVGGLTKVGTLNMVPEGHILRNRGGENILNYQIVSSTFSSQRAVFIPKQKRM